MIRLYELGGGRHGAVRHCLTRSVTIAVLGAVACLPLGACKGSPPLNAVVVVVNQSGDAGTFQWVSADSAAGTEPIPACDEYRRTFGPGTYRITIAGGSDDSTFDLEVSASQHLATTNVTINPNGLVEVSEERAPALPSTCPSQSGSAADSASVPGTPPPAEVDPDEIMVLFEGRETPDEHELSAWLNEWGLKETAVNRRTGWYRFRILDGSSVEEKVAQLEGVDGIILALPIPVGSD